MSQEVVAEVRADTSELLLLEEADLEGGERENLGCFVSDMDGSDERRFDRAAWEEKTR